MNWQDLAWEVIKLTAQALTALFVARRAVRWALDRFKQEKVWERQLAAQSDIIVALAEMRRVYGRWIDKLETHADWGEEADRDHADRYRAAKRKLEEAIPLAQLLLPNETTLVLQKLEQERMNLYTGDQYEDYNLHYRLLDDAIQETIKGGRQLLPR